MLPALFTRQGIFTAVHNTARVAFQHTHHGKKEEHNHTISRRRAPVSCGHLKPTDDAKKQTRTNGDKTSSPSPISLRSHVSRVVELDNVGLSGERSSSKHQPLLIVRYVRRPVPLGKVQDGEALRPRQVPQPHSPDQGHPVTEQCGDTENVKTPRKKKTEVLTGMFS